MDELCTYRHKYNFSEDLICQLTFYKVKLYFVVKFATVNEIAMQTCLNYVPINTNIFFKDLMYQSTFYKVMFKIFCKVCYGQRKQ